MLPSPRALPSSVETLGESRLSPGIIEEELCFLVVSDILLARRWKFCEDMRFLFGSLSGSGVPVLEGGEFTLAPNVTTAGIGVVTRSEVGCMEVSSLVGNDRGSSTKGGEEMAGASEG